MNRNQTLYTWGVRGVSLGFVAFGLWTLLAPFILGVDRAVETIDLSFIQAALIPLWPHPLVHIAITLGFPLLAIMAGLLGLFRLKMGWWGIILLTSFGIVLFSVAFLKTYVLDVLIRYGVIYFGVLLPPSARHIHFLVRALVYSVIFVFMFRDGSLNIFGLAGMKKLPVAGSVLAINVALALILYDFVR